MSARVLVPPDESVRNWEQGLEEIGWRMNLEIDVIAMES
jgi:glycine cleavage system transcriptional repressor